MFRNLSHKHYRSINILINKMNNVSNNQVKVHDEILPPSIGIDNPVIK